MIILDGFEGLGTKFWLEVFDQDFIHENNYSVLQSDNSGLKFESQETNLDSTIIKLKSRIEFEIKDFESKYSRFLSNSELNKLNANRSIKISEHNKDLLNMIQIASLYAEKTEGVFDIFIKEKLEGIGYGPQNTQINTSLNLKDEVVEFQTGAISIRRNEEENSQVRGDKVIIKDNYIYLSGKKGIDLGGIGKGYLIKKLSQIILNEFGLKYFVINGGGDIYATSDNEDPIELMLQHPVNADEYIYKIKVKNQSLCASSSFKRSWDIEGRKVNHFIDKERKGVWAASYIVADDVVIADMAATVACICADDNTNLSKYVGESGAEYLVFDKNGDMIKSNNFPELYE